MTEQVQEQEQEIDDPIIVLKFPLSGINTLIKVLNEPVTAPTILKANAIGAIQAQATPQIDVLNANIKPKEAEQ